MLSVAREVGRVVRADTMPHRHLRDRLVALTVFSLLVDAVGTLLIWRFERGAVDGGIATLWDAFFWTTGQLLTVSSNLPNPVTVGGRLVDIVLEVYAITVIAFLAGSFAAFLHHLGVESGSTAEA